MKKHTFRNALVLFLYGILAALPIIITKIHYLSFVAWIPFCYHIKTKICDKDATLKRAYGMTLCFFLAYFMAAFSFFVAMYPLDFAGLNEIESIGVLFAAMLLLPLFQAVPLAFSGVIIRFIAKKRFFRFPGAFSLFSASVILLFFYLQNFTWAGVPWASPAVALTSAPLLIQSASLFGSGFLVFLILFINALLAEAYDFFRSCKDKKCLISLALALLLFASNLGIGGILLNSKNSKDETKVALIQGCAPIKESYTQTSILNTCRHLAREAAKESPDIMLWSETVLEYSLEFDERKIDFFSSVAVETGAIQVIGAFSSVEIEEEEYYYNALFVFYPDGTQSEEVYHKRRPVPFGEYLPLEGLFKVILPSLTEINMLERNVDAGADSGLFHLPSYTAGSLICFDSIYPTLARQSVKDGAEILLISTNDSWFDGSFGKSLHRSHAILRAVENGRAVARTGNTGYSVLINEKGECISEAKNNRSDYTVNILPIVEEQTLYTRIGDVFVYLCGLFIVLYPIAVAVHDKVKKGGKSHE